MTRPPRPFSVVWVGWLWLALFVGVCSGAMFGAAIVLLLLR